MNTAAIIGDTIAHFAARFTYPGKRNPFRHRKGSRLNFKQPFVVPANAGTHTPRRRVFGTVADAFCCNKRRWLWVPAFAGTTHRRRNDVKSRHAFAPRDAERARAVPRNFRPKRGRGECRVPVAPAASCAVCW
jgi:hypothetical protein